MDGSTDGWMHQSNGWIDGWLDGLIEVEWINGQIGG